MSHPNPARLQERLDGALPAGEARALDAHLAACAACARDFAGLKAAVAAFAAAPAPRLTRSFNRKVLAALRPSPATAYAAAAAGAACAVWTAAVAYAVVAHGRPSWAAVAALGDRAANAVLAAGVLAAKLPLPEVGFQLARRAGESALPLQLGVAAVVAASFIVWLGRPRAASAWRHL